MVKGRLPRESNPLPGDKSGFAASHDTTGEEDYKRTSPLNPLPVKSIGDSNVKDPAVKAELELIKQGIADNKATNDLILARLDNPINTQVTGSNVEDALPVKLITQEVSYDLDFVLGINISPSSTVQLDNHITLLGYDRCTIVSHTKGGNHTQRISILERDLNGRQFNSSTTRIATDNYRTVSGTFNVTSPQVSVWLRNEDETENEYDVSYYLFQ